MPGPLPMADGSGLQIHNALDLPQHVPQMARWIHDAFWATDPVWTQAYIEGRIAEADDPAQLPLARLALMDSKPAGTASLIACDDQDREHLTPWLAAVYVDPAFRGRGIASLLVRDIAEGAARLGFERFYLGTAIPGFYAALGAEPEERVDEDFMIMRVELPA